MSGTVYKAIDLFAGIGGIRMGFDQAFGEKIETVFVSEFDGPAQKTYRANFDDPFDISGDITQIEASQVPDFDICLAGFPCQAFSLAGKRKGFDDDYKGRARGTLFFDMLRICTDRDNKPKVIFCENVKGLPIHDRGRTFETILGSLREEGYVPFYKVLNSKNFGVPQNRERIYIVAFREDIAPETFDFPTHAGKKKTIEDILDDAPISPKYYLSDVYMETLRRHLIIDHREHSMTPITNIKGEINKEDIRKMTPREWARLQGFPDSYNLTLADTQLYKQFGNSVTVPVIKAIASRIKEVLNAHGE